MYCVYMIVFIGSGCAVGLNIFLKTDAGVQIILYLLWVHLMVSIAFWMAAAFPNGGDGAVLSAVAAVVFTGLVANLVVVQFVQSGPQWLASILELIPSFSLFRCLWEMAQYAFLADLNGSSGLEFSNLSDANNGTFLAWGIMAAEAVLILWWAYYYEVVFGGSAGGQRRHPFFILGFTLGPDDPRGWSWFMPRWKPLWRRGAKAPNKGDNESKHDGKDGGGVRSMTPALAGAPSSSVPSAPSPAVPSPVSLKVTQVTFGQQSYHTPTSEMRK
ncbi:hypothetical protein FOA52_003914 [Chlamydomonas sp. UWO 241]|nr:hypothetical protein FOA52_003914 [Chlamydomonas sp. UWO 241]